jgi:hypothetical protein
MQCVSKDVLHCCCSPFHLMASRKTMSPKTPGFITGCSRQPIPVRRPINRSSVLLFISITLDGVPGNKLDQVPRYV